ncbi:unnamed protein product [Spirodela intermedia]|uniref:Protein kinase domain-containing protein n=1 Tax=Spirodela intermedia TaxID=51605 RepID=A0A7I8L057_SPIIN|nr:unnamed protein product [Spirodela intermedia]
MESQSLLPAPLLLLLVCTSSLCVLALAGKSPDEASLLALKSSVDPSGVLPWRRGSSAGGVCSWYGVRQCSPKGRVTKLVLESVNLTGNLHAGLLSPLDELRVLSFKSNFLSGEVPDMSGLTNLKALFLDDNRFSGEIPASLGTLHRLKAIALSGNGISGRIPDSLTKLPKLYALFLQNNRLSGRIPALNQRELRYLNVSGNLLAGEIPRTLALRRFDSSSFAGNPNLCGVQLRKPCKAIHSDPIFSPPLVPSSSSSSSYTTPSSEDGKKRKKRIAVIVSGSAAAFLFLAACVPLAAAFFLSSRRRRRSTPAAAEGGGGIRGEDAAGPSRGPNSGGGGGAGGGKRVFSWEAERLGKLTFCGGGAADYSLEELLKASAETLGRGTAGSTYKAVMESGLVVTVKRLKDPGSGGAGHDGGEFRRGGEALGAIRHPNLVPLRAYFQAQQERLLVYDYFPNGSLLSLLHGSSSATGRGGGGKPLHWTSCLKIAEDVAAGLQHLHEAAGVVHGNVKPSNVLLGSDFECCLTDYSLAAFVTSPDSGGGGGGGPSLVYRAPECRQLPRGAGGGVTPESDVYGFGVLVLELLTGKAPFQDLVEEYGEGIPQWVRSVREQGAADSSSGGGNEAPPAEEKLAALVSVAAACVSTRPEERPAAGEALRMIREARAAASSNGSDQSPGRWSDAVQSLPRSYGLDHMSLTERD